MTHSDGIPTGSPADAESGFWSHALVSLGACVLTVSIVGSIVFLGWRVYDRRQLTERVEAFVSSLQNRTPDELADRAESLKAHPKVARFVLPRLMRSIATEGSDRQLSAAITIARAFVDDKVVEENLFQLRVDVRETVAAAAVAALGELDPPQRAAEVMGQCLVDARSGAAVDEACAALYRLGDAGLKQMETRLSCLSVERRVWLVGYVGATDGTGQRPWLVMLSSDPQQRVRDAAAKLIERIDTAKTDSVAAAR